MNIIQSFVAGIIGGLFVIMTQVIIVYLYNDFKKIKNRKSLNIKKI